MVFDVAYANDLEPPAGRAASVVRGRTGAASCGAAALCDVQCDGAPQYRLWRAACRDTPAAVEAWTDPVREARPSALSTGVAAIAWFASGVALTLGAVLAGEPAAARGDGAQHPRRDREHVEEY